VAAADPVATAAELCIFCCACVKNCPTGARVMAQPRIRQMTEWLSRNCARRREPDWFL
jgi:ferredoxin